VLSFFPQSKLPKHGPLTPYFTLVISQTELVFYLVLDRYPSMGRVSHLYLENLINECWNDFCSYLFRDMKGQFARHLHEMKFLKTPYPDDSNGNYNSRNVDLVKAIVCAGLYPNVAMVKYVHLKKYRL